MGFIFHPKKVIHPATEVDGKMVKFCTGCEETLPLEMFNKQHVLSTTFRSQCRNCVNAKHREWELKNKLTKQQ